MTSNRLTLDDLGVRELVAAARSRSDDVDPLVAIGALGDREGADRLEAFTALLGDPEADLRVRHEAARLLGREFADAATRALADALESDAEDEFVRRGIVLGLGFTGDVDALDVLDRLGRPSRRVRASHRWATAHLGTVTGSFGGFAAEGDRLAVDDGTEFEIEAADDEARSETQRVAEPYMRPDGVGDVAFTLPCGRQEIVGVLSERAVASPTDLIERPGVVAVLTAREGLETGRRFARWVVYATSAGRTGSLVVTPAGSATVHYDGVAAADRDGVVVRIDALAVPGCRPIDAEFRLEPGRTPVGSGRLGDRIPISLDVAEQPIVD